MGFHAMEESPGSTEERCRLTAGGGDPRESATENRPPTRHSGSPEMVRVRVKRCGKSAPRPRQRGRQGKPHREQDRIGTADGSLAAPSGAPPPRRSGWSREACREARPRGMVAHPSSKVDRTRLTDRLASFPPRIHRIACRSPRHAAGSPANNICSRFDLTKTRTEHKHSSLIDIALPNVGEDWRPAMSRLEQFSKNSGFPPEFPRV
ncbi:hypothetical protein C7453_105233 [Gluconacetobacter liquefaciens]|uniref:Uncharacterized protein n=1 Tax=Gluconacetobacter liquefaciens TaxID=89584 RepID=A0A370G5G4_GLULI|nr:hypothetical protein C7453_105233 [Gluconacetobacter liquefaciens]